MSRRRGFNHKKLEEEEEDRTETDGNKSIDDDFTDEQFYKPKPKTPWISIFFISILFIGGLIALFTSCLILIGFIDSKYTDRILPLCVLGCLMFIPGSYYFRIICLVFLKVPGYSIEDIPEFN